MIDPDLARLLGIPPEESPTEEDLRSLILLFENAYLPDQWLRQVSTEQPCGIYFGNKWRLGLPVICPDPPGYYNEVDNISLVMSRILTDRDALSIVSKSQYDRIEECDLQVPPTYNRKYLPILADQVRVIIPKSKNRNFLYYLDTPQFINYCPRDSLSTLISFVDSNFRHLANKGKFKYINYNQLRNLRIKSKAPDVPMLGTWFYSWLYPGAIRIAIGYVATVYVDQSIDACGVEPHRTFMKMGAGWMRQAVAARLLAELGMKSPTCPLYVGLDRFRRGLMVGPFDPDRGEWTVMASPFRKPRKPSRKEMKKMLQMKLLQMKKEGS